MVARGGRCRGGVVVKKKKEESRSGEEKMKEGGIGVQMAVELAFPTFNREGWRGSDMKTTTGGDGFVDWKG